MKNNKLVIVAVCVVVVLVIAGILYAVKKPKDSNMAADQSQSQTQAPGTAASQNQPAATTPAAKPAGDAQAQKYSDAVVQYKDKRLQFSPSCQATPTSMVLKNPATIMLDNRSASTVKVVIDQKTYTLGGYGWQVITLNETSSPSRSFVDCGSQQNVAELIIQK